MIHECNINCYSMDPSKIDALGIEDKGKWLPFAFSMHIVDAVKLTSDDIDEPLFNCTSIFTANGDAYIIDTPFKKFTKLFVEYHKTK